MRLNEGLREGDLRDIVLPLISIDEYESKISDKDDIIVVGFFLEDDQPAKELNRFISRSSQPIVDTDISPAPTESGYFIVFIELERNEDVFKIICSIIEDMKNITCIDKWTFKAYHYDEVLDFTKENFNKHVRLTQETQESFEIKTFFSNSIMESFSVTDGRFNIGSYNLVVNKDLKESIFALSFEDLTASRRLDNILGSCYSANVNGDNVSITNLSQGKTLYAKLVND